MPRSRLLPEDVVLPQPTSRFQIQVRSSSDKKPVHRAPDSGSRGRSAAGAGGAAVLGLHVKWWYNFVIFDNILQFLPTPEHLSIA